MRFAKLLNGMSGYLQSGWHKSLCCQNLCSFQETPYLWARVAATGARSKVAFQEGKAEMTNPRFPSHPLMLGFDQLERAMERTLRQGADGYPPFNIELTDESGIRITLALAGFRADDLSITVQNRQLMVRGSMPDTAEQSVFLHRGIAGRQFQRAFVLAEGVEVQGAALENGLLSIDLSRAAPEDTVQTIKITRP